MFTSHIQGLMTRGHSLSNKLRFGELRQGEFETWVNECYDIVSACKPEPEFPYFPRPPTYRGNCDDPDAHTTQYFKGRNRIPRFVVKGVFLTGQPYWRRQK